MDIPLIGVMKKGFVLRRLIQTFFGGARLKFKNKAPIYIYFTQIALLFMPCIIGISLVVLAECNYLVYPQYMYIYAILMFTFVLCVQIFTRNAARKISQLSEVKVKSTSLTDSDQLDVGTSCYSPEMVQLLIPAKKHFVNIIFHSLVSSVMCGLCIHFLLPSKMNMSWPNAAVVWILMILGWFSVCVAQFPLTTVGAPEPAVYRALDSYEIMAVSRALYIIAILSVFSSVLANSFILANIILATMPLLWCTNILPPADVLLSWMAEQFLVHFLGGSPQMSNFRLFMLVGASCSVALLIHNIPYVALCKILLVVLCGILSNNIGQVFDNIRCTLSNYLLQKDSEVSVWRCTNASKSPWLMTTVTYVALAVIAVVLAVLRDLIRWEDINNDVIRDAVVIAVVVVWFLCYLLSDLQSVYCLFGLVRNPLYPTSYFNTEEFKRDKIKLQRLGTARFILLKFGLLVGVFYLSLLDIKLTYGCWTWSCMCYVLALIRCYTYQWRDVQGALVDLIIVHVLYYSSWLSGHLAHHPFVVWLLLVSIVRHRIGEVVNKLYVIIMITVTSVCMTCQRLWYNWWLVALNILLLPVVMAIIITSSVLSAPLLPLFTLPVFFLSFVRPVKFWPNVAAAKSTSDAICTDAIYYKQLAPRLALCLSSAIRYGSLGCVLAGNHYVIRFEDRMIWLQVLEHGHNYVTMVMKGLELHGTSCHTYEAGELEVLFENAFNYADTKQVFNRRAYNCATPLDTMMVRSYSETKNTLVGVIDSPLTLQTIPQMFPKVLSMLLFIYSAKCASQQTPDGPQRKESVQIGHLAENIVGIDEVAPAAHKHDDNSHTVDVQVEEKWAENVLDSSWSDDDDPLGEEVLKRNSATYMTSLTLMPDEASIPGYAGSNEHTDQIMMYDYGSTTKNNDSPELKETLLFEEAPMSRQEQCKYARIGLKPSWINTPRDKCARGQHVSSNWMNDALQTVLNDYDKKADLRRHFAESNVMFAYDNVVQCCTRAFFGENGNTLNPASVYRTFLGDLQWTLTTEWLRQNDDLMALALQAFRYSVKLSLDRVLYDTDDESADQSDHLELYKQLKELLNNWFVGPDNIKAWNTAIQKETPNMFAFGYNAHTRTCTGHLLTLKEVPVHICRLNSEMVRAIWASLNLELLYLLNDDEERYSIQAHPLILRNLTVQAADPPLGYPLYMSAPITMYI